MQSNNSKKIEIAIDPMLKGLSFIKPTTYEVSINEENFLTNENLEIEKKIQESKFNIRVKKCDLYLLDEMAKHLSVSRSTILNHIVHEILKKEVGSIKDIDTVALIAHAADVNSKSDEINDSWTHTFFKSYLNAIIENTINWNSPQIYFCPSDECIPMETLSSESFIEVLKKIGTKN